MELSLYPTTYRNEQTYWWYVARLAILKRFVGRALGRRRGLRILNLGCGTGATSEGFQEFGEVMSADPSHMAVTFCRSRGLANLAECSAERLAFADGSFDLVMMYDVLEHVEHDIEALREIRRVLKQGGLAALTVPAFRFMWSRMDDIALHRRRYLRRELRERMRTAGLSVLRTTYFNTLLFPVALAERAWERVSRAKVSGETFLPAVPPLLNSILKTVFRSEARLLDRMDFPFGLSLLSVARR